MTLEQLKKLMDDSDDISESMGTSKIPDADQRIIRTQRIWNENNTTAYGRALTRSEEAMDDLGLKTDNRHKLSTYAQVYDQEKARNAQADQREEYYKDMLISNRLRDELGETANIGSFLMDTADTISMNAAKAQSDIAVNLQKIKQDLTVVLDAQTLYNVASSGKSIEELEKSSVIKDKLDALRKIKEANPNDRTINDLYEIVFNQDYAKTPAANANTEKSRAETVKLLANYAEQTERTRGFQTSDTYEHNQGLQQELQNLETRKQASYPDYINYPLSGVGIASRMIPSIAASVLTSGIGGITGTAGNTLVQGADISTKTLGGLQQAASLGTMYMSATGDAFTQTLAEGYGWDKANTYAKLIGLVEVATELIGGENVMSGIAGFASHTATSKAASALISKGKNFLTKYMIAIGLDIGAEALEEMIASAIDPILDKTILGKDITPEEYWQGILESARDSVIPTVILGGFGKARVTNQISKINKSLQTKLNTLHDSQLLTNAEYENMSKELEQWTNDAIAGVNEHYTKIKNELGTVTYEENYADAMDNMDRQLGQRASAAISTLNFAKEVSKDENLTTEQKQQKVADYAKTKGINDNTLKELFSNVKEVFPFMHEQAMKTAEKAMAVAEKTAESKKAVKNLQRSTKLKKGLLETASKRYKTSFTQTFSRFAKVFKKEARESGVVRLKADGEKKGLSRFGLGTFDSQNKPTYQEIMNSPILYEAFSKGPLTSDESGRHLYIYDTFEDFEKDVMKYYDSWSAFMKSLEGVSNVITMSGKGGYTMALENGKIVWKDTEGETTIKEDKRKKSLNKKSQNDWKEEEKRDIKVEVEEEDSKHKNQTSFYEMKNRKGSKHDGRVEYVEINMRDLFSIDTGEYDPKNKPSIEELENSPVILEIEEEGGGLEDAKMFRNLEDLARFITNTYGAPLTEFVKNPGRGLRVSILSAAGYGSLWYNAIKDVWETQAGAPLKLPKTKAAGLTKDQKSFFSKVADVLKKGKFLITAYHTMTDTRDPWYKVKPKRFGNNEVLFLSDNKTASSTYAHGGKTGEVTSKGLKVKANQLDYDIHPQYAGYLNMQNPFVVDAKNNTWMDIEWEIDGKKHYGSTEDIVYSIINYNREKFYKDKKHNLPRNKPSRWYQIEPDSDPGKKLTQEEILASGGYDGIVVQNVMDYGDTPKGTSRTYTTDYIVFNSNQFKLKSNLHPTSSDYIDKMADMTTDDFMAILGQLDSERIAEIESELVEEKLGDKFDMDWADYITDDIESQAIEIAYNEFLETEEGQEFLKSLKDTDAMYERSDMEKRNAPIPREIENKRKNPSLRQTGRQKKSLARIRRKIEVFVKGQLGKLKGPKSTRAFGTHNKISHWIRVKDITDVDTLFHELGHYIGDVVYPGVFDYSESVNKDLETLCEIAFPCRYKDTETRLREGLAEAIRRYVDDTNFLKEKFPVTWSMFEEIREDKAVADTFKLLDDLREDVLDYENMTADERLDSMIKKNPYDMDYGGPVDVDGFMRQLGTKLFYQVFNDNVYANRFDRWAAKRLGKKYRELLSIDKLEDNLRVNGGFQNIAYQLLNGITNLDTGEKVTYGFKEILEVLEPSRAQAKEQGTTKDKLWQKRIEELGKYGIAKRMQDLYRSKREIKNLGMSLKDVDDVVAKYQNDKQLNEALQMIHQNSKNIVRYAYENGLITEEEMEQIQDDNPFYFPLNRVQQEKDGNQRVGYPASGRPFYHLAGSTSMIENPMISLAANWGTIIRKAEENATIRMMVETAKTAGNYGVWFDTDVAPEIVKKATERLEDFKGEIQRQLKDIQKMYGIQTYNGKLVNLMNLDATKNLFAPTTMNIEDRVISYYENGKRKYIQFANNNLGVGLFDIFSRTSAGTQQGLLNIFAHINAPLKLGATAWNPEFAFGNMQSDAIQRQIFGNGNFLSRVYVPILTNVFNAIRYIKNEGSIGPREVLRFAENSDLFQKFMRSGADQSGKFKSNKANIVDQTDDIFGRTEKQMFGKPSKDLGSTAKERTFGRLRRAGRKLSNFTTSSLVADVMNYLPEVSEQATRFAEFATVYNKMIKKGESESVAIREAGMKARQVTQDFTVQGKLMREVNKMVPFASATVGGLYRAGQEIRNNPKQLTARLAFLAFEAVLVRMLLGDEDRKWYEEANDQKKFDNFIFPDPLSDDKQHPRIVKKPQGPLRYFVNLVELIYDAELGYIPEDKVEDEYYKLLAKSFNDMSPVSEATDLLPGLMKAIVENAMNVDFFYGTPIVSSDLQKLDPKNQYDEYTSEVSKFIGNIVNVSPAQIDNILKKWFAGTGKQVLGAIDSMVRAGQENQAPEKDISEKFMTSRIFVNTLRSSSSVNEVYDRLEELEREEAEGRMTFEQEQEYEKLKTAKTVMSKYSKQIKATRTDSTLSAQQKKDRIDELQELRADAARYYLGKELLDNANKNKIELVEYYPANETYTYTVNKNNKVEVSFADPEVKEEYAELFRKLYEQKLKLTQNSYEYKHADEKGKAELESKAKTSARTEATNTMKERVYRRSLKK